ncbi:MAG: sugar-binding domain-containing protein [Lachnospiraceae bacterium]|nr:sugar-binding domain-containing protein [Lachnospiraceae bacterium]
MENERFMFRVLEMYYTDEMSQAEIAKKMNVSRATICRTIFKAKQEGHVTIHIHHPKNSQHVLEEKIERCYGLTESVIASVERGENIQEKVNHEAVRYLFRVLKNHMTLGITWGLTIGSFIEQLKKTQKQLPFHVKDIKVVPFVGTAISNEADYLLQKNHANLYAMELAEILKGIGYQLPAPMYVSSLEAKKILEDDPLISRVIKMTKQADIGLLPIGQLSEQASIVKSGVLSLENMKQLQEAGGAGEVLGNFFCEDGTFLDTDIQGYTIGISREQLMKIPLRIGIAYGKDRVSAIKGALNCNIINVLITDSMTAEALL